MKKTKKGFLATLFLCVALMSCSKDEEEVFTKNQKVGINQNDLIGEWVDIEPDTSTIILNFMEKKVGILNTGYVHDMSAISYPYQVSNDLLQLSHYAGDVLDSNSTFHKIIFYGKDTLQIKNFQISREGKFSDATFIRK